ncbi:co-chaperone GroES [Candidatus Parcubacteria bacterium]|nr:co-chaperone GroES [Candidatus Parcubacteria bacterium]
MATSKQTKIIPLGDRVLIRPFKEEEVKKVGNFKIILPESISKEKSDQGKVLAVGEGKMVDGKLQPVRVKVGDTVIFSKYGFDEVKQGEEDLYLLKEDNILAVVK